jgi:hypothetical protein
VKNKSVFRQLGFSEAEALEMERKTEVVHRLYRLTRQPKAIDEIPLEAWNLALLTLLQAAPKRKKKR